MSVNKDLIPMSRTEQLLVEIRDAIIAGGGGGGSITVDDEMSLTSTNPVQNKVITAAVNQKPDRIEIDSVVDSAVDDALLDNTATDEEVEDMTEHLDDL